MPSKSGICSTLRRLRSDPNLAVKVLTFEGHTDQVWGVAVSPDGKRIVSCGDDKTVKIWDAEAGDE